jgi:energy-coupling factor transporter ATP-binding protein EcfA2
MTEIVLLTGPTSVGKSTIGRALLVAAIRGSVGPRRLPRHPARVPSAGRRRSGERGNTGNASSVISVPGVLMCYERLP